MGLQPLSHDTVHRWIVVALGREERLNRSRKRGPRRGLVKLLEDSLQSKLGRVFGYLSHKTQSVSTLGEPLRFPPEDNLTSDSINRSHRCAYVIEERQVCVMYAPDSFAHLRWRMRDGATAGTEHHRVSAAVPTLLPHQGRHKSD